MSWADGTHELTDHETLINAPAAVSAREAANMLTEIKKMDQQNLKPHKQGNED